MQRCLGQQSRASLGRFWFFSGTFVETLLKSELLLDSALKRFYAFLDVIAIVVELVLPEYLDCFLVLFFDLLLVVSEAQRASVHLT